MEKLQVQKFTFEVEVADGPWSPYHPPISFLTVKGREDLAEEVRAVLIELVWIPSAVAFAEEDGYELGRIFGNEDVLGRV